MVSFKNLQGIEGVDKLNECAPLIDEIFSDKEIFNENNESTFGEMATPIYKKHTDTVNKLFEILGEKPESAVATLSGITKLLLEISNDVEVGSFFMGTAKNLRSWTFAMVNTKDEQSKDL